MPATPLVIRAAPLARIRLTLPAAAVLVAVLILTTLRMAFGSTRRGVAGLGWWSVPATGILLGLPALAGAVVLWLRERNVRIVLDDGTLTVHHQFGRSVSWPRREIKALRYVPLRTSQEQGAAVLVLGAGGRVLTTLWHNAFKLDQLAPLATALGVDIERSARPHESDGLTIAEARRQYPGIEIPARFTHGLAIGCLGGLLVLGYVAAWVAALVLLTG
jgi:hypothetical protein